MNENTCGKSIEAIAMHTGGVCCEVLEGVSMSVAALTGAYVLADSYNTMVGSFNATFNPVEVADKTLELGTGVVVIGALILTSRLSSVIGSVLHNTAKHIRSNNNGYTSR